MVATRLMSAPEMRFDRASASSSQTNKGAGRPRHFAFFAFFAFFASFASKAERRAPSLSFASRVPARFARGGSGHKIRFRLKSTAWPPRFPLRPA